MVCWAGSVLVTRVEVPGKVYGRDGSARLSQDAPQGPDAVMPDRPNGYSLPMLTFFIVSRLEIFHRVNQKQQCSTSGVEVSF